MNLSALLNHSARELFRTEDTQGFTLMKDIRNALNNSLPEFAAQGLNAAIITEITEGIATYENIFNRY